MRDTLIQFASQFQFRPVVEHARRGRRHLFVVVGGMGGSQLPAALLNAIDPSRNLWVHKDYGLPPLSEHLACEALYIASSYSGNTEETLSFATEALKRKYALSVVTSGGKLLLLAQDKKLPLLRLPVMPLPPRLLVGASALGLAALLGEKKLMEELSALEHLDIETALQAGKSLAQTLAGAIPLVYASVRNFPVAYHWKISFNETAKIPAFCNMLPEANHNEIEGFDGSSHSPRIRWHVIFLRDRKDHKAVQQRMSVTRELYERRGVLVTEVHLGGESASERVFGGVAVGVVAALTLAQGYGNEPLSTPLIDQLKKRLV